MNVFKFLTVIFLLAILISGCEMSEDTAKSSNGTFSFTKTNGKTYTTTYVGTPIPSKNGTFSLQYKKDGTTGSRWLFFVLIDNKNDLGLNIEIPTTISNGKTYTSISQNFSSGISPTIVSFYGKLDNESFTLIDTKTNLVFEKSTYPGQIVGTFTTYYPNNTILGSGKFNFVVK
jgi:hypothetical protein